MFFHSSCHSSGSFDDFFENLFSDFGHHFFGFKRRFYTKEERIARLEKYKQHLEKELQGVNEAIERLKRNE